MKARRYGSAHVARALHEMARLTELAGETPFRARAYARGAGVVERLDDASLAALVAEGRLTELRGVGPVLAAMITELHQTGACRALEQLNERLPAGAGELSRLSSLGLAKIAAINQALGVTSVAELRAACETGRVRAVKGMGEKTERRLLEQIRALDEPRRARVLLSDALGVAEPFLAHCRAAPGLTHADYAGDLRRATETVESLVVILGAGRPAAALERALASPLIAAVGARGRDAARATLTIGLGLELRVVPPERYAAALLEATGAPAHVAHLRRLAEARGLSLDEAGFASEAEIYRRLGLAYVPPELREDAGELEGAADGSLPRDLVRAEDVQGAVHCHTVYSDGRHSVAQMARAAEASGLRYLTITDHSPTASYAGGLSVDRLEAQWEEIARVQETVSVRLLRGTESDILADGGLDYPDSVLERLDIVIASVHARHRMGPEEMTRRIARAMAHPCFKVWGHALGRLVLSRPPIDCRVEEILDVVAASRAAVEINGDPNRLDLPPRWIRAARERGIPFVISTDAHSLEELGNLRYGVAMARRGWVRRGEVLNTRGPEAFARAVAPAVRR
jgi:DNA polymerase (family 10)